MVDSGGDRLAVIKQKDFLNNCGHLIKAGFVCTFPIGR